jgi:hypothetical protein
MIQDWQALTRLTRDEAFTVTKVNLKRTGVSIEGEFELPPLGRLSYEDQVFIAEFIRTHGSIKQMEQAFGVSYPTIKNRLNQIGQQLQMVQVKTTLDREEILNQLERGAITPQEAAERLKK